MIDIIIPAYNAFETIGRTLGSIARQINRASLKVFIVNDGSEKSYDYIMESYKSILDIQEIIIENSGTGKARQVGLDSSSDEYVMFIDADDYFYENDSVLKLIEAMKDCDYSQGKFEEKRSGDSRILNPQYCYLHGKIYRRSLIDKYKIKIDVKRRYNGDIYEDSTFNQLYTLCANKDATIDDIVYVYDYNPSSITKKNTSVKNHLLNFIDAMTWLCQEIDKREITNYYYLAWNMCVTCLHIYFNYLIMEDRNTFDFSSVKPIKTMYYKYIGHLPYDEQCNIYSFFKDYRVIPDITFYEFMDKVK